MYIGRLLPAQDQYRAVLYQNLGLAPRALTTGLLITLILAAGPARAERIFYRASLWLETSPSVQHLSLVGVLQAWERLARAAERERLPHRQQAFAQLHRCLGRRGYATPALLERLTAFSLENPDGVYYSLSDFAAEALRPLCPE
jgi:hypothetical protein